MFSKHFNQILTSKCLSKMFFGAAAISLYNYYQQNKSQCCGIVGIISNKPIACQYCLEGIQLLQNRGYDSAGIASINTQTKNLQLTKFASDVSQKIDCIDKLNKLAPQIHSQAQTAIGHTRWATCGKKTDENAHPHCDMSNRVAIVHNGTIDNILQLKQELESHNVKFKSETDTELIAQFIGLYLNAGNNLLESVKQTVKKLEGTWGIVAMDIQNEHQLVVCRNGSPIQIGYNNDTIFVASEYIAFQKYTHNYITVLDHELMLLDLNDLSNFVQKHKEREFVMREIQEIQTKPIQPYHSFFEQEIEEQPDSILRALGMGSRLSPQGLTSKLGGLEPFKDQLLKIENLILVGCGSSLHAGLFALKFFKILDCFNTIQIIEGSEFQDYDLPEEHGGVLFISQSGETADMRDALSSSQENGLFTIGVVNVVGSQIASQVNCGVYLNAGREVSVPATKSFSNQVVVLILIAIWFSHHKNIKEKELLRRQLIQQLRQLPICFGQILKVVDQQCLKIAKLIQDELHLIILGKGTSLAISQEGALKLKEVTYIHAEAFSVGELKNGPLGFITQSSINKNTKVIITILDNEDFDDLNNALVEVKKRMGYTIVISDSLEKLDKNLIDEVIEINNLGELTPMLALIIFQKIANFVCVLKEIDPDKPRNLAKTVTVK